MHYTQAFKKLHKKDYQHLVKQAFKEDHVNHDVTTLTMISNKMKGQARIISKQFCVMAGIEVIVYILKSIDKNLNIEFSIVDGDHVNTGDTILEIRGKLQSILVAERVVLNFLSILCGISTLTYQVLCKTKKWGITLLDTRKTIPGWRNLSKYAVYVGGGTNHRWHLADMGMIKDNHWSAVKDISKALAMFTKKYPRLKYQIEVDTMEQLEHALQTFPYCILLDNLSISQIHKAVKIIHNFNKRYNTDIKIEASGNYTPYNVYKLKYTKVDYVSMSYITMNFNPINFSMEILNMYSTNK